MFDSNLLLQQLSIRLVKSCRRALTRITAASVVSSLIVTRLDYCNRLLAGCTKQTLDKLQRVLNCSARVIFGGDSRQHVTPLLRTGCILFKLCILVYKAIHGEAPRYLNELCIPLSTVPNLSAVRSAAHGDLFLRWTKLQLSNREFCVAGPIAWNSLPLDIRSTRTLSTFKNMLKTHLFSRSYFTD